MLSYAVMISGDSIQRVLIVGAGIGGLTAAIALKRAGFQVQVLERVPRIQAVGAGITLQMNAMAALERLDLCEPIVAAGNLITEGRIQYRTGATLSTVPFGEIGAELGQPFVAIHRGRLQSILLEALGNEHVVTGVDVKQIETIEDKVRVPLADGGHAEGDLLIGADGLHSYVYKHLWGERSMRYSGYSAWRGLCNNPHAWPREVFTETWGNGQLFGCAVINEDTAYWFATKLTDAGTGDEGDPRQEILDRFAGWPEPIEQVIAATPKENVFRNDLYDRPPRFPWGKDRITLLGDAIHPMTPNMGQGGCQAVEDAVILAHCLSRAPTPVEGLRVYEQQRHPRTKKFVNHSRLFTALAHGQYLWSRIARAAVFPWLPAGFRNRQMRELYRFKLD